MGSTLVIGAFLACAAAAIAAAAGWMLAAGASRMLRGRQIAPPTRVLLLAQMRLLPLIAGVLLVPTQIAGFIAYEVGRDESAGVLLTTLAAAGLILVLHALYSAARTWRATGQAIAGWRASATPLTVSPWPGGAWAIDPPFPVVVVTGVLRPQLFVARQVIETCTPAELAAIAAHENAHAAGWHNLIRLLFRLTPGAFLFPRLAASLETAWNVAAEESADDAAGGATSALDLASALTKVARLVHPEPPRLLAASALISRSDLEMRVGRLLATAPPSRPDPAAWIPSLMLLAATIVTQASPLLEGVHEAFELLVRHH